MRAQWTLGVALVAALLVSGCGSSGDGAPAQPTPAQVATAHFRTSLHRTRVGKQYWYEYDVAGEEGFYQWTGVNYDKLVCVDCHDKTARPDWTEPDCYDCHDTIGDSVADSRCLGCHGRQGAEIGNWGFSDVHRDADSPLACEDCHGFGDVHGDGTIYDSMLDPGAIDADCESCHPVGSLASNPAHDTHLATVDCSACHMQASLSCINCHFDSEVDGTGKFARMQIADWIFLLNRNGKVHAGTLMTLRDDASDSNFALIAPYYAHNITEKARECGDCHMSEALFQYNTTGSVAVLTDVDEDGAFEHTSGVIPVPEDFKDAFEIAFATVATTNPDGSPSSWEFVSKEPDQIQMITKYGAPLTAQQFERLNGFASSLHATRIGMKVWYEYDGDPLEDGFFFQVGVPYDDLACKKCHDKTARPDWTHPDCADCHESNNGMEPGDPPIEDETCLPCHGRQNAEQARGLGDYHRDTLDFSCTDCHVADDDWSDGIADDFHGDGASRLSMLEPGAIHAACTDCHPLATLPTNTYHSLHGTAVACNVCHVENVISCINCHYNSEVDGIGKFAHRQVFNWKFLVNRDGQVHDATLMTMIYATPGEADPYETFALLAPYYAHAIGKNVIGGCGDCHGNAAWNSLWNPPGGVITLLQWNPGTGLLENTSPAAGIIPVPPDYFDAFVIDFVDVDTTDPDGVPTSWKYAETGPDQFQMILEYGQPLTADQMDKLGP